jgi:hypothetical protein
MMPTYDDFSELLSVPFTFRRQPMPLPGELRIAWRISLILITLRHCRGRRASLPKLHLLNYGMKSPEAMALALAVLRGQRPATDFVVLIEPALGRALDLARGEGLVELVSGKTYRLTPQGGLAADAIIRDTSLFRSERGFLAVAAPIATEETVGNVLKTDDIA